MLLQALHQYAERQKLLASLPFQRRTVHLAVPLRRDGTLRGEGLVLLTTAVQKGKQTREEIGQEVWLPRFPGENNGGKAYYLAEHLATVCGVRKEASRKGTAGGTIGAALPDEPEGREDRNPVLAYHHFWQRIEEAYSRTRDDRLHALVEFRRRYLDGHQEFARGLPFLAMQQLLKAKEPELCVCSEAGTWHPIKKANLVHFEIDGQRLSVPGGAQPEWRDDVIWQDWATTYLREAYAEPTEDEAGCDGERETVCLVTGQTGLPIARSHKPKILGVPGLASGGYIVSFARAAPAFSSYGFDMGGNAPVAEQAAATYALALNELLASADTSFRVGEVAFCFWAEQQTQPTAVKFRLVTSANPKQVADFLKSPFAGIDPDLARQEQFLSVALSANAGRVLVREWLRLPLERAVNNLKQWFEDLDIAALGGDTAPASADEEKGGPCSLFRLAAAMVRDSKELKRMSEAVAELYRAALDNLPPPIALLEPVLAEFRSALVTDSPKKPRYPLNQSRFALIKLLLKRNAREGEFMPTPQLCDTEDAAYNLGRLLRLLAALQDQAHEYELEGPGIIERYYGAASAAPANVFAILWKLHNHHLRKLEQQGEKGLRAASAIRGRIAEIMGKFGPGGANQPPQFPRQLSLEEQGRFALGFYQQLAADLQAIRESKKTKPA